MAPPAAVEVSLFSLREETPNVCPNMSEHPREAPRTCPNVCLIDGRWRARCELRTDYRVLVARRMTHTAKSASGPAKAAS